MVREKGCWTKFQFLIGIWPMSLRGHSLSLGSGSCSARLSVRDSQLPYRMELLVTHGEVRTRLPGVSSIRSTALYGVIRLKKPHKSLIIRRRRLLFPPCRPISAAVSGCGIRYAPDSTPAYSSFALLHPGSEAGRQANHHRTPALAY